MSFPGSAANKGDIVKVLKNEPLSFELVVYFDAPTLGSLSS
jgi:hypothetical protein